MTRIILFLGLIALAALGAAWVADQPGNVALQWSDWRVTTSLPVFASVLLLLFVVALSIWSVLRGVWRAPERVRKARRERRRARGRQAITQGLLAIGTGDSASARKQTRLAKQLAQHDPLALLLQAQTAQLNGDRDEAQRAFRTMAEREDTRLLGLRGLFVEAQRADNPDAAIAIAEEALKLAPASTWASHAVLGMRCARGDWNGALAILDSNHASGLIDKADYRRQRGVLLTARALALETTDRERSRESIAEAVKLAPTLVPAAVLAAKYQSEAHQTRRAMKLVETAWLAHPHPDLADAYAHVRLGDSARQRLTRIETLAAKAPGHIESALALARAAIDATEFARARAVLAPFIAAPTQRVAMLMAEIERNEHGDSGRARAWTLRAVRALHDPVWTADGYVSDRWRPVSPVTGRIDAFQWLTPVAALPSDTPQLAELTAISDEMMEPPPRREIAKPRPLPVADDLTVVDAAMDPALDEPDPVPPAPSAAREAPAPRDAPAAVSPPAIAAAPPPVTPKAEMTTVPPPPSPAKDAAPDTAQDNRPRVDGRRTASADAASTLAPPMFRTRHDTGRTVAAAPVIPILRAPDDPGVDEFEAENRADDQRAEDAQSGGWRGFVSRWVG